MSTRRDFLKQAGVLGTAAAMYASSRHASADDAPAAAAAEDPNISYTVQMGKDLSLTPPKRKITVPNVTLPDVGEVQVLKGDFHMHTLLSDGQVWPQHRVIEADGNGLDVISVTDHIEYRPFVGGINGRFKLAERNEDYNFSYELAKPEADKRGMILIHGTEITKSKMPPGHFNALFINDANPIAAQVDDYRKMFEETIKQGGFLLWNHPGWQAPKSGGIEQGAPTIFTTEHEEIFKNGWMHGIEAFNGKEFYPVVTSWCADKDLAVFANSDIHPTEFDQYGVRNPLRPLNLILAKEKTYDSIKEAFFAKRIIGWANNMILGQEKWLKPLFEACVEIKANGDKFEFANKSSIFVALKVGDQTVKLSPLGTAEAKRTSNVKSIVAENWQIGKTKRLEIAID